MKKKLVVLLTMLITLLFVRVAQAQPKISLKLLGGINYLSPVDINKGIEGWNELIADFAQLSIDGKVKPIHFGFDIEGDIIINLIQRLGFGIGVGYIQGTKTSKPSVSAIYEDGEGTFNNKPKMRAIPIKLGLFYTLPLNDSVNVVFNLGGGLYLAKYSYSFRAEGNGNWTEWNQEGSSNNVGLHGGIGLELNLTQNIAIVLEGKGRYAKIGGFEGTTEISDNWGWSEKEEGKLYYFELRGNGKMYSIIGISEEKPSEGGGISNVRAARIDFSGFALSAGMKIRF